MKKYTSYIGILFVGLAVGWFLFGGSSTEKTAHKHDEVAEKSQLWTCSMHPQIMQPEAGDCPICGMDLIPAEATADGLKANQFKMTKNALALANIQTQIVVDGASVSNAMRLSGKIGENKDETATQPAHFNGRIDKLFINSIGEYVKKGQAIAEVYSPELVAAQQELITAYRNKQAHPRLYAAVRAKFKYWKIMDKQVSEIERSGEVNSAFTLYSHVSGVVSEIFINVGAHILDGHPMYKVVNLQTVWAEFDVYEKQIPLVKKGQKMNIRTNTGSAKVMEASISFVDPILDTKTRTVIARAVLKNTDKSLKPGMFVSAELIQNTQVHDSQITVPKTAVLWTGKRSLVYVKQGKSPVFEMREVILGKSVGKSYEITKGIHVGEEIVVNGTFTVDAAAQLQGKKSMMNKNGGKTTTGHEGHVGMHGTPTASIKAGIQHERIAVALAFQKQLQEVVEVYVQLKDALVQSDAEATKKQAQNFVLQLAKVDRDLLKIETVNQQWITVKKELEAAVNKLLKSNVMSSQRLEFIPLSTNLIKAVHVFGIDKKIYNQFCPMANNDKGANWLSFQEEIKNPYFGDAMLTCGNVEETIN